MNTHNKSVKTKCLYEILNNIEFNTHGGEVMYYPTKHVKLITLQSIFIKIQMSQIHVTLNTQILSVLQPSHKIWRKVNIQQKTICRLLSTMTKKFTP